MLLKVLALLSYLNVITGAMEAGRIFGGQQRVEPGEFPYNALIRISMPLGVDVVSSCGSIVTSKWILVSAHAVFNYLSNPSLFEVIAGKYNLLEWASTEQSRQVRAVIRHPGYDHTAKGVHDLALLFLTAALNFNAYVQPIVLEANPEYPLGAVGVVTGYGVIGSSGTAASHLTKLSVNILTQIQCANGDLSFNTNLLCTDPGTCEGDSGAPLFQQHGDQWSQLGLVSFGFHCALYGTPSYFTFLPQYLNWINETIVTTKDDGNGSKRNTAPLMGILVVTCSKIIIGLLQF